MEFPVTLSVYYRGALYTGDGAMEFPVVTLSVYSRGSLHRRRGYGVSAMFQGPLHT